MIDFTDTAGRYHPHGTTDRAETIARAQRDQQRTTDWLAAQLGGCGFRCVAQMEDWACARAVETLGRALTRDERTRLIVAARALWTAYAAGPRYELTDEGARALRGCPDCGEDNAGEGYLCPECLAGHVAPDRSEVAA